MRPPEATLESQLAALAARVEPSADGWQQIQARGRRRDRKRRMTAVAALAAVVVVAAAVAMPRVLDSHGGTGVQVGSPPLANGATSPAVNSGRAAWVSGGQVWVSSGGGPPRPVAGSAPAAEPLWSHDGTWLSYLRDTGTNHTELWVVHPNGSANTRLWTGEPGGVEWSPTADVLAVTDSPTVGVGGLSIISTNGSARQVVAADVEVNSFAWSPDGTALAVSEVVNPASTYQSPLEILTVSGARAGSSQIILRAQPGDGIIVGPWWPDQEGLLYWEEPQYSKSGEADGLALMSTALAGAAPVNLGTALVNPFWLTWTAAGQLLVVLGGGAAPSQGKQLELCSSSTGGCSAVPVPAGMEALDPALSPDGSQLSFVVAQRSDQSNGAWYATRRLWVADVADLSDGHAVAGAGPGAALPTWSPDGQVLRYSTATGVAVINAAGGRPVMISGTSPLIGDSGFNGETAFGKTPWPGHAVWSP
ncbi:MAG TPA: hypothetical protein VHT30_11460 [Acidimicrobiales bacterium]|jgi:dipeptidyl aminopeptidase/acylaminoacyl peptidase|nr:hypothetical protein [Acidimicrobiales bacterium]